ncbi:peptidoglycan recognition protein [Streptacidiphilus sp. MAP12-16]|uniref:peptidoglycan recognition protein family protein n=1 Tax=Streptacidiphilus sp. MAP12-16 TaxID=3156300 RepID=UPI0035146753
MSASKAPALPHAAGRGPARPTAAPRAVRWVVDQPAIVPRATWDTTPSRTGLPAPQYASTAKAVFVHHTDSGNNYRATEVPAIINNIDGDQTGRRGWDDIGYNFLVDRFGTIYEGRHGGIDKPVIGAHSSGFNLGTVGIAAIGTFSDGAAVPALMLDAITRLVAWKLSLAGIDPRSSVTLTCSNTLSRFRAGSQESFSVVSGHRDADCTLCPGSALYNSLPDIRTEAARIQLLTRHAASDVAEAGPGTNAAGCLHPAPATERAPLRPAQWLPTRSAAPRPGCP